MEFQARKPQQDETHGPQCLCCVSPPGVMSPVIELRTRGIEAAAAGCGIARPAGIADSDGCRQLLHRLQHSLTVHSAQSSEQNDRGHKAAELTADVGCKCARQLHDKPFLFAAPLLGVFSAPCSPAS